MSVFLANRLLLAQQQFSIAIYLSGKNAVINTYLVKKHYWNYSFGLW